MIDRNGDTDDTFPPFSTLEEDEAETKGGYEIDDDGAASPRVTGKVTDGMETASESLAYREGNDTAESLENGSEGDSERSGVDPLVVIVGVGYYVTKKKK